MLSGDQSFLGVCVKPAYLRAQTLSPQSDTFEVTFSHTHTHSQVFDLPNTHQQPAHKLSYDSDLHIILILIILTLFLVIFTDKAEAFFFFFFFFF